MRRLHALVARIRDRAPGQDGQVLVVLIVGLTVLMGMAALTFDAAQALVLQRRLQGAADAAAMAAANQLQTGTPTGCAASAAAPTVPRAAIGSAATASAATNLAGVAPAPQVTVTCPTTDPDPNETVRVAISAQARTFFLGALPFLGGSGDAFTVTAGATARFARSAIGEYSIIALEKTLCQGGAFSGGPTIILGGSFQVNSPCLGPQGGSSAFYNGGNPSVTLLNGSVIRVNGFYYGNVLNPPVLTNQPIVADPLAALTPLNHGSGTTFPLRSSSRLTCRTMTCGPYGNGILEPGIYRGGITLSGQAIVFLRPGIYILQGGGLDVGTGTLCAVDVTPAIALTATTCAKAFSGELTSAVTARWRQACAETSCGVLLYNTAYAGPPAIAMGNIAMQGGANLMLRQFQPTPAAGPYEPYRNLVIWQDRTVSPQAEVWLRGGGALEVVGTVYSPLGTLDFGGNSDAAGPAQMTMQVIANKVSVQGNAGFHFVFDEDSFAQFFAYGLIE